MVNSEPVDQLLVVLDVLARNFDRSLQVQDLIFLARLALEYGLERLLALTQLLQLLLVTPLFGFSGLHLLHDLVPAAQ